MHDASSTVRDSVNLASALNDAGILALYYNETLLKNNLSIY